MKTDDFFQVIKNYLTDANAQETKNVKNKESFKVIKWDVFEIGKTLFDKDPNKKLSIDNF